MKLKRSLLAGAACALSAATMSPTASAGVYVDLVVSNTVGLSTAQAALNLLVQAQLLLLGLDPSLAVGATQTFGAASAGTTYVAASIAPNTTLLGGVLVVDLTAPVLVVVPPLVAVSGTLIVQAKSGQLTSVTSNVESPSFAPGSPGQFTNVALSSSHTARDMGAAILSRF